ncbi:MAG: alpha/beta hydrolase [Gemmataceae bacterium]|nr:alpha/beta hydrolase [Gemmataceae bacterium]
MTKLTYRFAASAILVSLATLPLRAGDEPKIQADVIYGRKDGMALTFDVIKPAKANGAGIIWIQSGGWYSNWADAKILASASKPYLDKGYTMFIIRHASAPKYAVPDAVADVRRSVRVIRMKASEFGANPERLGVFGGSAGGHLSLMLGTTGDDGDPKAKDPVLKSGNRLAAVVALYPPTDLRGWTTDPPEVIKKIPGLKPPLTFDEKLTPSLSPILHVSDKAAPTLLIHGDKDLLVPIDHSHNIMKVFEKTKAPAKLVVVEGAAHGFSAKQNTEIVLPAMLEWFDKHLAARKEP